MRKVIAFSSRPKLNTELNLQRQLIEGLTELQRHLSVGGEELILLSSDIKIIHAIRNLKIPLTQCKASSATFPTLLGVYTRLHSQGITTLLVRELGELLTLFPCLHERPAEVKPAAQVAKAKITEETEVSSETISILFRMKDTWEIRKMTHAEFRADWNLEHKSSVRISYEDLTGILSDPQLTETVAKTQVHLWMQANIADRHSLSRFEYTYFESLKMMITSSHLRTLFKDHDYSSVIDFMKFKLLVMIKTGLMPLVGKIIEANEMGVKFLGMLDPESLVQVSDMMTYVSPEKLIGPDILHPTCIDDFLKSEILLNSDWLERNARHQNNKWSKLIGAIPVEDQVAHNPFLQLLLSVAESQPAQSSFRNMLVERMAALFFLGDQPALAFQYATELAYQYPNCQFTVPKPIDYKNAVKNYGPTLSHLGGCLVGQNTACLSKGKHKTSIFEEALKTFCKYTESFQTEFERLKKTADTPQKEKQVVRLQTNILKYVAKVKVALLVLEIQAHYETVQKEAHDKTKSFLTPKLKIHADKIAGLRAILLQSLNQAQSQLR